LDFIVTSSHIPGFNNNNYYYFYYYYYYYDDDNDNNVSKDNAANMYPHTGSRSLNGR